MKTRQIILSTFLAFAALASVPSVQAQEDHANHAGHAAAPSTAEPAKPAKPEKPAVKPYKLETCIVSDDKLGEMGKPVVFDYKGQEIKLCCKSCRKDFDKDPEKFLKKLVEKQK